MTNKEFSKELEKRTLRFAIDIIKLSSSLGFNEDMVIIKKQLTKSGTSIGANYREANRARSKADFANKIKVSEAEASETIFWLEIIKESSRADQAIIMSILNEANELLAILSSIGKSLRV